MDMEQLQLRFKNASDMKERSKIRTAIQKLRMEEESLNESPLSRRSFRRSRRLKNTNQDEQISDTISTNTDESKTRSISPEQQESIVEDEKPQNFVRNSSIRRNRISRSSRTSRSSDQDVDSCTSPSHTSMNVVVESQKVVNNNSKGSETRADSKTRLIQEDDFSIIKNHVTRDVTTGNYSPQRIYAGNINKDELPTNATITQGATCQYRTIKTSFRGPKWKPVSTPDKSPTHRQSTHTHSANINNNNKQEWPRNRASHSAHTPEVASSGGDAESSKSHYHQKHPARTVLKALGKKLFSAKPKPTPASGHQIPTTPIVRPTSEIAKFFPTSISTPKSHNTSYPVTSSRPSPFQERKKVFEQKDTAWKPTWGAVHNSRGTNKSTKMADVMSLSRTKDRDTGSQQREKPEVVSEDDDVEDTSLEELDSLLKQYKGVDKRVKIRETIRLLKESLREEDTSTSGSHTSADNPPASGSSPTTHKSEFSFTSTQSKEARDSSPFTVSIETPQPSSRIVTRSTSLRTSKPSYTPPAEAIHRASSFKLSRPKDFIVKKVDSTPQLAKVSEEFRDYADTLNNNVPKYNLPENQDYSDNSTATPSSSHNKTASPFSASPKSSFRKTTWTPPILQKSASNTSLVSARTVQVTSLRRSESTKENRSSDFQPIPIVRGNVRRSKSILGRILGQKIGLDKEPLTAAFTVPSPLSTKDKFLDPNPKEPLNKSVSPIPESTSGEQQNFFKDTEIVQNLPKKSYRSENSSVTSSVSEEENVYEINNEEDLTRSSEQESDNESVNRDKKNAEFESESVFVDEKASPNNTVELLKVEIVSPISTQNYNKETEDNDGKSDRQDNKETRLSSSTSSADFSDDEDSSPEDDNMDHYSTRALQSRVSVKSQVVATENNKTNVTSSRRLRERVNKPLNTGDDVKSRIQKYKVKLDDDEIEKVGKKTQRNGSVRVPGASGKKLDTSRFENGRENVKTTVTISSSSSRNGTSLSSTGSDRKSRNSSSSSATDDSARQRRTRRAKATEAENGAEKLEKASIIATSELKNSKITTEVTTKKSRERAIKEDVNNNNTKSDKDVATPNDNVEVVLEDSLSSWSERRRKRREKKQESLDLTSGTENDKSSDNSATKEPEPEVIPTIKHVPHSEPVLSNMDADLHGYSVKLTINGNDKPESPKDKTTEETQNETATTTTNRSSRVRSRYSRSSETRSSTSSSNDVIESTQEPNDKDGLVLIVDTKTAEVEMESQSAEVEVTANKEDNISDVDENIDTDVTKGENVNERMSPEEEEVECEEQKETIKEEVEEDNKESEIVVEKNESDVTSQADDTITKMEEITLCEDEISDKITPNNEFDDEKVEPTQINENETLQANETEVYKDENVSDEVKIDTEPEKTAKAVEKDLIPEIVIETPTEQPSEDTTEKPKDSEKKHKKRHKESKEASEDTEKSERRRHRKKDKTSDDKTAEEEKPKKRRHRKKSSPEEDGKAVETEKVEEVKDTERKSRRHKEKETEKTTPEPAQAEEVKAEKVKEREEKPKVEEKVAETAKSEEKDDKAQEPKEMLSLDNIADISDIKLLEKMLYASNVYEERRQIRSAIRALKKGEKPKKTSDWTPRNGSALKSKENQKDTTPSPGDLALRTSKPRDDAKESRITSSKMAFTKIEKSELGTKYTSVKAERTTMTSGQKKIGSIFDRGDDEDDRKSSRTSGSSRTSDLERRQAERRRELQRNRSMPAASSKDARKAFVAKLEASAPKTQGAKKVGRSPTFVVPNANNVKQLLLKWCQSKTRGYEHVDIMNFSSSWASGMAFCALTHRFFPEAFDYEKLDPKNRAENFDLAFKSAEKYGDIAPLLEVEDMIIMGNRPDSKCVFTYVQFLYNHLKKYDQPLVPIKKEEQKLTPRTIVESEDL